VITAQELTRRFGDFTAVRNLSFEIQKGQICALLGPNGAGKSTTLNMLSGLLAPSSGTAYVDGVDVNGNTPELRNRIGVVPEKLGLFDELTVMEHLLLTGRVYGLRAKETSSRAEQLARVLDLGHSQHKPAIRCSHGTRKKTALAMALLPNPAVLLLDEPFEGVDPVTLNVIEALLEKAAAGGATVFLTSHMLPVIQKLTERIMIMRSGEIVWNSDRDWRTERPLDQIYFETIEPRAIEELDWLG
jgi:ABC-2 type transport system ATP-binding protein